jgi:hypothetical protein
LLLMVVIEEWTMRKTTKSRGAFYPIAFKKVLSDD